jgi:hypothetical protein
MIKYFEEKGYTNNRWFKRYFKLMEYSKNSVKNEYELHHILPKSIFPELKNDRNFHIRLSLREHIIAHYLLAKACGGTMWYPIILMNYSEFNSRLFERAKIESNKIRKEYITVFNIDENKTMNILIKDYNPYNHITNSRKYSSMPESYLKKLYLMEFNTKYETNFVMSDFGENYKKVLHKIRTSIRQSGQKNCMKRPEVVKKMKLSQKRYYENNPGHNLGNKTSEITKQKQSLSAKNRKSPSRAKKYSLMSPIGVEYICYGNIGNKVKELSLSLNTLKTRLGEVVPEETRKQYNTQLRKNTTGWRLTEVQ